MKRNLFIGIALLILILGVSLFSFFTFSKSQKETKEKSLKEKHKFNSVSIALEKEKKDLRSLAASLGVNYFSRRASSSQTDTSIFMFNRISKLADKCGVKLVSFSPSEKEEKKGYTQFSFSTEISSAYLDMINFFYELEEKEKLIINNLKITTPLKSSFEHQAQFKLSCMEFKHQLLKDIEEINQKSKAFSHQNRKLTKEVIARDPFLNPLESTALSLSKAKASSGFVDLSPELNLTGISTFPHPITAIINHKIVKKGDWIKGKQIIEIKKDQVIFKMGEQLYILKLRKVAPLKRSKKKLLESY